jgi:hypothetical protein
MSQRSNHDSVETNETGESSSHVEKAAASALAAGVWDGMRRETSPHAKEVTPGKPDGVEVIHPWSYMPSYKAEAEGRLQMDDQGKKFMNSDGTQDAPTDAIPHPTTLSSTVFTSRRADGSVESVSASFDKKEHHDISINPDGTVKSITVSTPDGKQHRVEDGILSERNEDGSMSFVAFNDGNKMHIYNFDRETKEVAQVETREGNHLIRRTIAEGNEISNIEQIRDAKKNVVEEYTRDANQYTAMKVHPDHVEQVSVDRDGVFTTNQVYKDGQSIMNVQSPNGDYQFTQTDANGNTFKRSLLRGNYTTEYSDSQGNWMKQVTDKATNKTHSSRGDRDGNVVEGPETVGM